MSVTKTIIDVIYEFYIANDIKFDFIIYGQTTNHINDIINEVTKELSKEIEVKIIFIEDIYNWNHELTQSAIILTTFKENLTFLHQQVALANETSQQNLAKIPQQLLKFTIYVEEIETLEDLENTMEKPVNSFSYSDLRFFEFFITKDENFVNLTANVLFSEDFCGEFHLKLLNTFDIKSQEWNEKLRNFNRFEDFHDCFLSFFVTFDANWYAEEIQSVVDEIYTDELQRIYSTDNLTVHGLTNEILKLLSIKYKITTHLTFINKSITYWGSDNFQVNLNFGTFLMSELAFKNIKEKSFIEPLYSLDYYFLVTLNDLYTNYEKILMPFDLTTWILLTLTICLTFVIIFGSLRCPQWIQTLIHGEGINSPFYNALGIIFGISQLKLPTESRNRYALLLFIWFCLMFRTCYQSILFEFMTSDMRKPLPASIEDLIEFDYTIKIVDEFYDEYLSALVKIANGRKMPNIKVLDDYDFRNEYKNAIENNGELEIKAAFLVDNQLHGVLNFTYKNSLTIMDNERVKIDAGYEIIKNSLISSPLNHIIKQLIPTGIMQYLVNYGIWYLCRPFDIEIEDSKKILSLSDLEYGFVLWLASLSVPIICFLCEILSAKVQKLKEILKGAFWFLLAKLIETSLKSFMEIYHDKWSTKFLISCNKSRNQKY